VPQRVAMAKHAARTTKFMKRVRNRMLTEGELIHPSTNRETKAESENGKGG
jgi:hypothetical protein